MRAYTILKNQTKIYWQVGYSGKGNNFILSVPMFVPFDNKIFSSIKEFINYYTEMAERNEGVFVIVRNKFETHLI